MAVTVLYLNGWEAAEFSGVPCTFHESRVRGDPPERLVVCFDSAPGPEVIAAFAHDDRIAGVLLPEVSPYSHLGWALVYFGIPFGFLDLPITLGRSVSVRVMPLIPRLGEPNTTQDERSYNSGNGIEVLAQIQRPQDVEFALEVGADGVGEIRSELLFTDNGSSHLSCREILKKVSEVPQWLPAPVRFFDFSNDKPLPVEAQHLDFSALGYRGVRVLEVWPEVAYRFDTLMADVDPEFVTVVAPMVADRKDIERLCRHLRPRFERFGVTIETPSAVMNLESILPLVELCEIGLNDLTQYTLGWNRGIPSKRLPVDRIPPAVTRLVRMTAEIVHTADMRLTVVFDLPPTVSVAKELLEVGVDSFAVPPRTIPGWRRAVELAAQRMSFD